MSLTGISANRLELLQIAEAVAREKSIEKEIVIEAIEEAIQKGARARYGAEHDIRVHIDPKTGETTIKRVITVVEDDAVFGGGVDEETGEELPVEEPPGILRLADAKRRDKDAKVGQTYEELLPPFEFGRVQTQMARQVVMGKVRDAERERQYEEYKDRVGEVVNGTVKRVEYGNVVVDLGRGEGIMRRDQSIPRENFNLGDRIRCYIYDVRREQPEDGGELRRFASVVRCIVGHLSVAPEPRRLTRQQDEFLDCRKAVTLHEHGDELRHQPLAQRPARIEPGRAPVQPLEQHLAPGPPGGHQGEDCCGEGHREPPTRRDLERIGAEEGEVDGQERRDLDEAGVLAADQILRAGREPSQEQVPRYLVWNAKQRQFVDADQTVYFAAHREDAAGERHGRRRRGDRGAGSVR